MDAVRDLLIYLLANPTFSHQIRVDLKEHDDFSLEPQLSTLHNNQVMALKSLMKNLIAFILGLAFIILVDLALGLFSVSPLATDDPFTGFVGSQQLFNEPQPGLFVLNESKSRYFNTPQSFSMPKPAGVFRIVVFGGSTTYGRPYRHETSFGKWLEKLLEKYGDISEVEVINAGGISYASYRVRRLVEEMSAYQPDLFVVYSGHNEFLEARTFAAIREQSPVVRKIRAVLHHSRLYSLLARKIGRTQPEPELGDEVKATLEQVGGPELYHRDEQFRQNVIQQYRNEMQQILQQSQQKDIPVILCTLPVNLSAMSPFKSEHTENLEGQALSEWQTAYNKGVDAMSEGRPVEAVKYFIAAEKIDGKYALLQYRKGQVLESLGEYKQAYKAYDMARQEDIVPLRALNEMNNIVREFAEENKTPMADVERFFIRVAPNGLPGTTLFADHVHPTIEGQQIIAWSILNTATEHGLVPLTASRWSTNMMKARDYLNTEASKVSDDYRTSGLWGVGRLFFWAGKYEEAYEPLLHAWSSLRNQPEIPRQLGSLELLRNRPEQALVFYDAALEIAPGDYGALIGKADSLVQLGQPEAALRVLDKLQERAEADSEMMMVRGRAFLDLGRTDDGLQIMKDAVSFAPEAPSIRYNLALALAKTGQMEGAKQTYREYLRLTHDPNPDRAMEKWLVSLKSLER